MYNLSEVTDNYLKYGIINHAKVSFGNLGRSGIQKPVNFDIIKNMNKNMDKNMDKNANKNANKKMDKIIITKPQNKVVDLVSEEKQAWSELDMTIDNLDEFILENL